MKERMRTDFFKNGAVQQSGRCEVSLKPTPLPRKGDNIVGSIPTRSPNLIGLACGVNRGQPQGAEGVGAYSNLAKPARFLTLLLQGNRKNHPEFSPRVKIVNARRCVIRLLATIAQWAERLSCTQEVAGSSPAGGSNLI